MKDGPFLKAFFTHVYTNTHTVTSFLLPLCAPHAIWPSGCSGVATHNPRGSHQDKRPLRWERGGRKGPLKHKRAYAINNTSTYFIWLFLCYTYFHCSTIQWPQKEFWILKKCFATTKRSFYLLVKCGQTGRNMVSG